MRQIVLDTETTGLEISQGNRIIEIGCVELINRRLTGRHYHVYINPQREVEEGAFSVHGLSDEFLSDKPLFSDVVDEFLDFVRGGELIIHNAPFDVGFLDHELSLLGRKERINDLCGVIDSLVMARRKHPGARVTLDALCQRYGVDNSSRTLHGALLDSEILADVYLLMTGGQTNLALNADQEQGEGSDQTASSLRRLSTERPALKVIMANDEELAAHNVRLDEVDKASGGSLWRKETSAQ